MKTIVKLLCIFLLVSIPMALLAAERDDYMSRDYYGRQSDNYGRSSDTGDVSLSGSVKTTDKHGRKMQITIGGRTEKIRLADEYRVYSGSRRIDLDDLRKGESVRIEGYRARGNEIIALAIYLASTNYRYDDRSYRDGRRYGDDTIRGRVVRTTSILSRTLRVADLEWSGSHTRILEVEVRKDAQVIRQGRTISVREIRTGDEIEGRGTWTGSEFIADYITVNGDWRYDNGRDYDRYDQTYEGVVQDDLDYRNMRFTLDNGPDKFKVYGGNARVVRDGNAIDFRDIRKGDVVAISGGVNDHTIYADHVDISRSCRTRDWYY